MKRLKKTIAALKKKVPSVESLGDESETTEPVVERTKQQRDAGRIYYT